MNATHPLARFHLGLAETHTEGAALAVLRWRMLRRAGFTRRSRSVAWQRELAQRCATSANEQALEAERFNQ